MNVCVGSLDGGVEESGLKQTWEKFGSVPSAAFGFIYQSPPSVVKEVVFQSC